MVQSTQRSAMRSSSASACKRARRCTQMHIKSATTRVHITSCACLFIGPHESATSFDGVAHVAAQALDARGPCHSSANIPHTSRGCPCRHTLRIVSACSFEPVFPAVPAVGALVLGAKQPMADNAPAVKAPTAKQAVEPRRRVLHLGRFQPSARCPPLSFACTRG